MNSTSLFHFMEWGVLILVLLASMALSVFPRRVLAQRARESKGALTKWLLAVLASLLFPLLAMAFFFLLGRLFAPAARWLGSDARLDEPRGLPVFGLVVLPHRVNSPRPWLAQANR